MKLPIRYKNASYEDVPKNVKDKFEIIRQTRKGLYIHGAVGTGKTHIAYALYDNAPKVLKIREWDIRFWNTTELLREFRLDFDRHITDKHRDEEELVDFLGILVLDDFGGDKDTEKPSKWEIEKIYLIINKRYNEMRPTIFTSNFAIEDLADRIGDRTTSRIVEMCDIVHIGGKDRRLPK